MGPLILLVYGAVVAGGVPETDGMRPFLSALRTVETGGIARPGDAVGDRGRSIGPYQISRAYWVDSGVVGSWERCRERWFAEAVMTAYWKRHCPDALRSRDFETLARIHNGGPNGHRKAATKTYWSLVRGQMEKTPARGYGPLQQALR